MTGIKNNDFRTRVIFSSYYIVLVSFNHKMNVQCHSNLNQKKQFAVPETVGSLIPLPSFSSVPPTTDVAAAAAAGWVNDGEVQF